MGEEAIEAIEQSEAAPSHHSGEQAKDQPPGPFAGHLQDVHALCLDAGRLASGSRDTAARVFDPESGKRGS